MMKHIHTFESFLNEAEYWKENVDTRKVFPVKNDREAESLLSGRVVTTYQVENSFSAKDVYGKTETIDKGTTLDVHILINSDSKHNMYVDRKRKRYFPSNYRGEDQIQSFEDNITNIG